MKLHGHLGVMSLPDLLQWIMTARKTGRLDVQRTAVSRSIFCRDGRIIACSSEDPSVLLGQFLLFHGRISEDSLRDAMRRQESTGKNLGALLVELGAISQEQLLQAVTDKAMETIHGIFDWKDAGFEFVPDSALSAGTIEVDLDIQEVLMEGARRLDEMAQIREVFPTNEIVLQRTEKEPQEQWLANPMARRIYAAIDGHRALGEIVLACNASEFMACQYLLRLHELGLIAIREVRQAVPDVASEELSLDRARALIEQRELLPAIQILQPLLEQNPADPTIKRMLANAEAEFVVIVYRRGLHPANRPVLQRAREEIETAELSVKSRHLLDRIDGRSDIRSIMWVVPMRPVEVLASLMTMKERGLIEILPPSGPGEPDGEEQGEPADITHSAP